jgi:hypothetical protein
VRLFVKKEKIMNVVKNIVVAGFWIHPVSPFGVLCTGTVPHCFDPQKRRKQRKDDDVVL